MSEIRIDNLCKKIGAQTILQNISLSIASGELVVLVGPSGSGKSTLLRCLAGLESIDTGNLFIGDAYSNATPPAHRGVAMVFQNYALYPHMTVFENIAYNLRLAGLRRHEIAERVRATAAKLELTDYLDRRPNALSGGQRQRVAIGRAIVRDPKIFLFDEPLSNLDAALRVQMRGEIMRLHMALPKTTMIYVTHDQIEAMTLADRIVLLRDGRVEQIGTPRELYEAPANLFVARFIGSPRMNILPGHVLGLSEFPSVGLRPEAFAIAGDGTVRGRVTLVENAGADSYLHLSCDNCAEDIILRAPGSFRASPGEIIPVAFDRTGLHAFDQMGERISL